MEKAKKNFIRGVDMQNTSIFRVVLKAEAGEVLNCETWLILPVFEGVHLGR